MDKLLCLLEKYRCHLNRGNKSSVDFLRDNYSEYISDVKAALSPEDNQLVGAEMCKMVSEQIDTIEKNASLLIEVLELYNKGRIVLASQKAFEVFENMKPQLMQRYSGAYRQEAYFRIRSVNDNNPFTLNRKELFHIPFNKNYLVGTERYSMPGHPCLYLASQAETRAEHLEAHYSNWQNPTNWYYNPVTKEKFDFGAGPFIPCEIIQLPEPIISLTDDSTIQEIVIEEKENFSKAEEALKQSTEISRKMYSKPETPKTHKVQIETSKKANNAFVKGLKSVGRFIVEHPGEVLEIAGLAIGGVAKAVSSIKGRGSGSTHSTASTSSNSSVAEKVADIVEKTSRSLPSENDVTGHKQRYHTKNGVVWKDKAPYHRGGK